MQQGSSPWELDSDEIASVTSDDLNRNRPNRWTGPKSTWRAITEEERLLWHSMKQLRDQDLGVHLYNAFALKRRGQDAALARDLTIKTADGQEAIWAPPRVWTAWPVSERHLPDEGLIKKQDDEDEAFTFRRAEEKMPSSELQEELSAMILRTAKDRFMKSMTKLGPSVQTSLALGSPSPAPLSPAPSAESDRGDLDRMDLDNTSRQIRRRRTEPKTYDPVVSSNDDLSHKLLQPSVRHTLSLLDKTLTLLHNARLAGLGNASDSSEDSDSDSQTAKLPRGRPRRSSQPGDETSSPAPPSISRRGRPRKVPIPREGETHEEMLTRIARTGHRRLPAKQREKTKKPRQSETPEQSAEAAKAEKAEKAEKAKKDARFNKWYQEGEERIAARARARSLKQESDWEVEDTEDTDWDMKPEQNEGDVSRAIRRKRERWGLRDWSDIVGAAALAGFPADVIARTTKRCADLFGEGMEIRQLDEVPASRGSGVQSTVYHPERISFSSSSSDVDSSSDDAAAALSQRRIAGRRASLAARSSQESTPEPFRGRLSKSPSRSRSRSVSRSSGAQYFCPVPSCDRAANGFARRSNLKRHMDLVHQGQHEEEVDSDDEVVGAVHVDGFLKTIVPSRGWRGEDATMRKRKKHWGQRQIKPGGDSQETSPGDSSSG